MDSFSQFLDYLVKKIQTSVPTISDPLNVIIGESKSLVTMYDDQFPRAELLISKLKFDNFIDQRMMSQSFRFSVAGYIKRHGNHTDDVTPEDMYQAITFGRQVMHAIMDSHNDKIAGVPICDGFQQINGFPEVHFEYEMFDQITAFIVVAEAEIQLIDTYI